MAEVFAIVGGVDDFGQGIARFEFLGAAVFKFDEEFTFENQGEAGNGVRVPAGFGARCQGDNRTRKFGGALRILNGGTVPSGGGEIFLNLSLGGNRLRKGKGGESQDEGKNKKKWLHNVTVGNGVLGSPRNCPTPRERILR